MMWVLVRIVSSRRFSEYLTSEPLPSTGETQERHEKCEQLP